jgi:Tfp pilus assembly protein PilO
MIDLVNKLISNIHFFIIAYGLWGAWGVFDGHSLRMEDLNNQFPSVEAEIVTNKKKVKEIQEFVKKTEESKIRVEQVAKNIEAAQRQLPAEINDNQILTFFNQEINTLNIKDPNILPGAEVPSVYFISKEYSVKSRGTFLQFLVLFERIGGADRIYNIKKVKLSNGNASQRGRFQMIDSEFIVEAFRFNPAFKVDRGFQNDQTPNP